MLVGALAALWSAHPEKTASEILEAVFLSADQANSPDNDRGYGLPNMTAAWLRLGGFQPYGLFGNAEYFFAFDRDKGELDLLCFNDLFGPGDKVELRNFLGQKIEGASISIFPNSISTIKIGGLENLPAGAYQVLLRNEQKTERLLALTWK